MESLWLIPTRISIHAPREGSDGAGPGETRPFSISIHAPREGSDGSRDLYSRKNIVISIHAPREGSDTCRQLHRAEQYAISIHAPREGSDALSAEKTMPIGYFNPRSPRGERPSVSSFVSFISHFNPRSPRGERRSSGVNGFFLADISIHAPREGSDQIGDGDCNTVVGISIHAPREGSDAHADARSAMLEHFNPRSPRGERLIAVTMARRT